MPNPAFRPWTADDIAKLKNMAEKHSTATIARELGRSVAATAVKAHELKLSLRMPGRQRDQVQTSEWRR
jgi:bifunctional pyridoxal-dependent enzyme with beta-cystathionase and maltose regulon repressor activities